MRPLAHHILRPTNIHPWTHAPEVHKWDPDDDVASQPHLLPASGADALKSRVFFPMYVYTHCPCIV